jgi:hypothetical protein
MILEFKKDFKGLTLGKVNKMQMVIHLMDENLLQKENLLAKTLSFNFLIQTDDDQNKPDDQNKIETQDSVFKDIILTLEKNLEGFKTGIKNPVITENIEKLSTQNSALQVTDAKRIGEEIGSNINEYNKKIRKSVEETIETLNALTQAVNKFNSNLATSTVEEKNYLYEIDRYLLLNVLKENFIDKIKALLPENIVLTKIHLTAYTIEGKISEDTNCLNIAREIKIWEDTHVLNQVGTNPGTYYYARGFLLVQVKTSHSENLDKLIYFPNPALSKEIAENTPNTAQFVVIKNTGPTMSSLKFLTNDYEQLNLSNDKNIKWTITPIFLINNSFVKGVKAEFIRFIQRGNVSPSIERTDYKKVIKEALDLQKQALEKEKSKPENEE